MSQLSRRGAFLLPLGLAGFGAACTAPLPQGALVADPTGRADPEMRAWLESFVSLRPVPIETLSPAEARGGPSFANAIARRLEDSGRPTAPRPMARYEAVQVPGAAGSLNARLYGAAPRGAGPQPLIVYFHGGGWVIADMDVYDNSARALAAETGALVLGVNYRRGPETRFPGAHDDANAVWTWVHANAASLGADPSRIAVAGESAGGNLAVNVAIFARDRRLPAPKAVAAIYPVAGTDTTTPSYNANAGARFLSRPMVLWFVANYTNTAADLQDPRLNLYGRANLAGLPPVIIVNAEIDPLLDDGAMLEARLRAAGTPVTRRVWTGVAHEFFGADAIHPKAREAQAFVAAELRNALGAAPARPAPGRRAPRA